MSPSGASAIGVPAAGGGDDSSSRTASPSTTYVRLASAKSASSVAAQNTGAVGTPVARSSASARASVESALDQV